METETTIARDIRTTDLEAAYDKACKKLLAEKSILAWILKQCVEEYKDCTLQDIAEKYIEGTPQVDDVPVHPDEQEVRVDSIFTTSPKIQGLPNEAEGVKEQTIYYDIRFRAIAPDHDGVIQLIINVEAQNRFNPGYPLVKRGLYYCSRLISAQYGTEFNHAEYDKLKKVYSIWVCTDTPPQWRNTITQYSITEQNLVGDGHERKANYDLMSTVLICLGQDSGDGKDAGEGVLRLLRVLLSSKTEYTIKQRILERDYLIPMTQTMKEGVSSMCNLSAGVKEEGIQIGTKQGIEIGTKQGIKQGALETLLNNIRTLMETMNFTAEQAMNALKVPREDQSMYLAML